jgi:hypothetical protein
MSNGARTSSRHPVVPAAGPFEYTTGPGDGPTGCCS